MEDLNALPVDTVGGVCARLSVVELHILDVVHGLLDNVLPIPRHPADGADCGARCGWSIFGRESAAWVGGHGPPGSTLKFNLTYGQHDWLEGGLASIVILLLVWFLWCCGRP